MKSSMIRQSRLWLIYGVVVSVGVLAPCQAQTYEDDALEQPVNIDFRGGTVREYVSQLKRVAPGLNVVVTEDAAQHRLPSVELHSVNGLAALYCLDHASSGAALVEESDTQGIFFVTDNRPEKQLSVTVFNVSAILMDHQEQDLLSAIEIGLSLVSGSEKHVELKLHRETGLLFVKGKPEELQCVVRIVSELHPGGAGRHGSVDGLP